MTSTPFRRSDKTSNLTRYISLNFLQYLSEHSSVKKHAIWQPDVVTMQR
jgi:hypothetical protein